MKINNPLNNLPVPTSQKVRSRLRPGDPDCITDNPKLLRVDLGRHSPEDDPRRVEAREQHERYLAHAPGPFVLDKIEALVLEGEVRVARQTAPGVYLYATRDGIVFKVDRIGTRPA